MVVRQRHKRRKRKDMLQNIVSFLDMEVELAIHKRELVEELWFGGVQLLRINN